MGTVQSGRLVVLVVGLAAVVGCAMPMSQEQIQSYQAQRTAALEKLLEFGKEAMQCPDDAQSTSEGEVACSFQKVMVAERVNRWADMLGASAIDLEQTRTRERHATTRYTLGLVAPPLMYMALNGLDGGNGGGGCSQEIYVTQSSFSQSGSSDGGPGGEAAGGAAGAPTRGLSIGGCGNVQNSEDLLAGFNNRFSRVLHDAEGSIGRNPQLTGGGDINDGQDDADRADVGLNLL